MSRYARYLLPPLLRATRRRYIVDACWRDTPANKLRHDILLITRYAANVTMS